MRGTAMAGFMLLAGVSAMFSPALKTSVSFKASTEARRRQVSAICLGALGAQWAFARSCAEDLASRHHLFGVLDGLAAGVRLHGTTSAVPHIGRSLRNVCVAAQSCSRGRWVLLTLSFDAETGSGCRLGQRPPWWGQSGCG